MHYKIIFIYFFFVSDQILNDIFSDRKSTFHSQLNQQNSETPPDTNIVQTSSHSSNLVQQNQTLNNLVSNFTNNFNFIGSSDRNDQKVLQPLPVEDRRENNNPDSVQLFSSGSVPSASLVPSLPDTTASILSVNQENIKPPPSFAFSNPSVLPPPKPITSASE